MKVLNKILAMELTRKMTLLVGLVTGVIYAFLAMLLVTYNHQNVSVGYIFILPLIMGAVPVLFSTKEQLQSYKSFILIPWGITMTFFFLAFIDGFEGIICLIIIIAPFLVLGSLGAFIFRLIKLKSEGKGTKLYASLLLPFLVLFAESYIQPSDQIYKVTTQVEINASKETIWQNTINVKNISPNEIKTHFIHLIGIPKPISGELDKEDITGIRSITWEKGIKFKENITSWDEGKSFRYDIEVDPKSIPPTTLDEHVMIGGKYFDVLKGGYEFQEINSGKCMLILDCTYRVTTNLNFYAKAWTDFILDDFNEMILEVIKERSEKSN